MKDNTGPMLLFTALIVLLLSVIRFLPFPPVVAYAAMFIASSLVYVFLCRAVLRQNVSSRFLWLALVMSLLVRLSFLGTEPIGSDDVYRYMWDGRVQAAGINPYRYAPDDTALSSLHSAGLPSLVTYPQMKTIYFPMSQWFFRLSYALSGEAVWGFQLLCIVAEMFTIAGLLLLLRELALPPWFVLIYAANPLVILSFSLDAHADALGFPFIIFGLLFYRKQNVTGSLILIGLSLLVKPVAVLLLPVLFLSERGMLRKLRSVLIPAAIFLFAFLPYTIGGNPFESLGTFSRNWAFNGALFNTLYPLLGNNQTARIWCAAVLAAFLLFLYWKRQEMHRTIVIAFLMLLLCSPVVHPWYVTWLAALLPLAPLASGIALASTISLSSVVLVTYHLHGIWRESPAMLLLEYGPVLVLLMYELWKNRFSVPSRASTP